MKVNLGGLKDMKDEVAAFLQEKLSVKLRVDGGNVILDDQEAAVRVRDVKLYVKKFLHHKGLRKDFKVSVEKGEVSLIALKREEKEEEE